MEVLFITHYDDLLGANRSMVQLITELREYGVNPTVLISTRHAESPLKQMLDSLNISSISADFRIFKHTNRIKLLPSLLLSRIQNWLVSRKFYGQHFDIIHSNSSIIDIGKRIAQITGGKHVWHLREFGDLDYKYITPISKQLQSYFYGGYNHFIAISNKIRNHFLPYLSGQDIDLIYNGLQDPGLKHIGSSDGIVRFCIVGFLHENKRQKDIAMALDEIVNRRKITNVHLTIVGGGDPLYKKSIEEYILTHNLSDYIELSGVRNDVPEMLQEMDVGIIASSNEAFGRVTIEYMMSNLAVIASDGGANLEIVDDELTGLIYPTGDITKLAECMTRMINNKDFMKQIAKDGRKKAIETFSSAANSQKIFDLYTKLLSK